MQFEIGTEGHLSMKTADASIASQSDPTNVSSTGSQLPQWNPSETNEFAN
jgi:hypothetical protein